MAPRLRELIEWLHRTWLDGERTMQSFEAGRFYDAAKQAEADLQRHHDDENDRDSK